MSHQPPDELHGLRDREAILMLVTMGVKLLCRPPAADEWKNSDLNDGTIKIPHRDFKYKIDNR